jgi:Zn-dependent oligopeptidase
MDEDGVHCNEVYMCDRSPCDDNADCHPDGLGLFRCKCWEGYTGSGKPGECKRVNPDLASSSTGEIDACAHCDEEEARVGPDFDTALKALEARIASMAAGSNSQADSTQDATISDVTDKLNSLETTTEGLAKTESAMKDIISSAIPSATPSLLELDSTVRQNLALKQRVKQQRK